MKNKLAKASCTLNVVLVVGFLWLRAEHEEDVRTLATAAMRGDEIHLQLHAMSLAAIEAPGTGSAQSTADALRSLIAVGEQNVELRRSLGLGAGG